MLKPECYVLTCVEFKGKNKNSVPINKPLRRIFLGIAELAKRNLLRLALPSNDHERYFMKVDRGQNTDKSKMFGMSGECKALERAYYAYTFSGFLKSGKQKLSSC